MVIAGAVAAIAVSAAPWVLAGGVRRSPVLGGSNEKEIMPTRFASFPFNSLTLTRNERLDRWLLFRIQLTLAWHFGFRQDQSDQLVCPADGLYSPSFPQIGDKSVVGITAERGRILFLARWALLLKG